MKTPTGAASFSTSRPAGQMGQCQELLQLQNIPFSHIATGRVFIHNIKSEQRQEQKTVLAKMYIIINTEENLKEREETASP